MSEGGFEIEEQRWIAECCDDSYWETRDGKLVDIPYMTDSHLLNCIAKIERESWRLNWLPRLLAERRGRGI